MALLNWHWRPRKLAARVELVPHAAASAPEALARCGKGGGEGGGKGGGEGGGSEGGGSEGGGEAVEVHAFEFWGRSYQRLRGHPATAAGAAGGRTTVSLRVGLPPAAVAGDDSFGFGEVDAHGAALFSLRPVEVASTRTLEASHAKK